MKRRIEAGTDIAMLGAWDRDQNDNPLPKRWGKKFQQALESDAKAGHLFLIHTGGDCGGPIDLLLDEEIGSEFRSQMKLLPGKYLLHLPSGRAIIGGVEDYRSPKPNITATDGETRVPPGDYALKCYVAPDESAPATPSKAELERIVGGDDFRYWNRREKQGCLGYLTLLLFPALLPLLNWKLAAGLTVAVVIAYFYLREELLKRNERYQRVDKIVNDAHLKARAKECPLFIFEVRQVSDITGLKGGSLELS